MELHVDFGYRILFLEGSLLIQPYAPEKQLTLLAHINASGIPLNLKSHRTIRLEEVDQAPTYIRSCSRLPDINSDDANDDGEPCFAVNHANPGELLATAFLDPSPSDTSGPVFAS